MLNEFYGFKTIELGIRIWELYLNLSRIPLNLTVFTDLSELP